MADDVYVYSSALSLDKRIRASTRRTNTFFSAFALAFGCILRVLIPCYVVVKNRPKFVPLFRSFIATDLVGEDLGYIQNWLQELTDERNDETRCACDGELVLRPENRQGI